MTDVVGGTAARQDHIAALATAIDVRPGLVLTSGFEYPGRYRRFDIGFVDPPLVLRGKGRHFEMVALHPRGRVLLPALARALRSDALIASLVVDADAVSGEVVAPTGELIPEEGRTRRPGLLSVVRALRDALALPGEGVLGLYGAFGYDLVFQFEELIAHLPRGSAGRDLVLYLPDRVLLLDHQQGTARRFDYEFSVDGRSTRDMPRPSSRPSPAPQPRHSVQAAGPLSIISDFGPGEFEAMVEQARQAFAQGDLFEATVSQRFEAKCAAAPSRVFAQLCQDNPAPYGFLMNLEADGHLVGASPEMFVRVQGRRVETCPIAGTIARGVDALGDAEQVLSLLSSAKDEAELTMCTDVDRNDKARICEPGSVRLLGRRQVEMYSRLIHTVDHLEGQLRPEFDALDALVSHGWAVTVTGAPKPDAMQFIEQHERSLRGFYSGAIGVVGLDGSLNTGMALRMMHLRAGVAEVRAGATLLHASDPVAEAAECRLKASAVFSAIERASGAFCAADNAASDGHVSQLPQRGAVRAAPRGRHVVLIDHRDSFVHMLGDYLRQAGAQVTTLRAGFDPRALAEYEPNLVLLSPGPGRPQDFGLHAVLTYCAEQALPVFGVCLGMQALVEFAGGQLHVLPVPRHGCASAIRVLQGEMFAGLPQEGLTVGRYHSLYATAHELPSDLRLLAVSEDDGCVMACAHRRLPFMGVQFHPESILSAQGGAGVRLIRNVLDGLSG